jgi:butyrate kinase
MKGRTAPTILVINPGSTSTKVALFRGQRRVFDSGVEHGYSCLNRFRRVVDQVSYRRRFVEREIRRHGVSLRAIDLFVGRGGLLRPVAGGVYAINAAMLKDLAESRYGEHASNLGAILAHELAREAGWARRAYIANPVVVDELDPVARVSGHPAIPRRSIFHALNQKAVAGKVLRKLGKSARQGRLIVAHVGGGISVGVHRAGRVVDVNDALEGEGPFSPERTGALPLLPFFRYVRGRGLSDADVKRMVTRQGGLLAHLGTNDCRRIVRRIRAGDRKARLVFEAFAYQVARSVAAGTVALNGRVDAVVLTGNALKCAWLRSRLRRLLRFIGPVHVLAGSFEMEALAGAALEVYRGTRRAQRY